MALSFMWGYNIQSYSVSRDIRFEMIKIRNEEAEQPDLTQPMRSSKLEVDTTYNILGTIMEEELYSVLGIKEKRQKINISEEEYNKISGFMRFFNFANEI